MSSKVKGHAEQLMVELLIRFEQSAGHRLLCELVVRPHLPRLPLVRNPAHTEPAWWPLAGTHKFFQDMTEDVPDHRNIWSDGSTEPICLELVHVECPLFFFFQDGSNEIFLPLSYDHILRLANTVPDKNT